LENVIEINRKKKFTLGQAQSLLPLVYRLSEEASQEVGTHLNRLKAYPDKKHPIAAEIEAAINVIIEKWQSKMEKLGAEPKGLWMADFDKGDGYYCWKFPENEIKFWHGYQDGYSGRILVE
jgi:hypothetical protein